MRILLYSYNYCPEPIGIAPLMTELAEGLVRRGHEVRVITGMPNYPQRKIYKGYRGKLYHIEEENGVTVQRCYIWIRPKPGLLARMILDGSFVLTSFVQALNGWRPDVILYTIPPLPVCVPAVLLGWLYSCPVVVNLQDILPEAAIHVGLLKNDFAIRIFKQLERFAYRSASAISVITDGFIENLLRKRVPLKKITCIPNWVDVDFVHPMPKAGNPFRERNGLDDKFVVLYSGNIALTQGLETVIDAAQQLQDIPNLVFVVVGEEKARNRLEAYCEDQDVHNVQMFDFQPREMLPELLAAADVSLVVQKRNVVSFNMPSKLQLLLASGRPIVASVPLNGMAARALGQSGGGMVVQAERSELLADGIRRLYNEPALATELGQQGRQYAARYYAKEQALDAYELLFSRLVKKVSKPVVLAPVPQEVPTHR